MPKSWFVLWWRNPRTDKLSSVSYWIPAGVPRKNWLLRCIAAGKREGLVYEGEYKGAA